MEISVNQFKRCDMVIAKGRIDSATSTELLNTFNSIMDNGSYHIAFNLGDVSFISSAGLRVLISTQKNCRRYNRGELVLCQVPENIMAALDLAGFNAFFKIFDTEVEAVGYF